MRKACNDIKDLKGYNFKHLPFNEFEEFVEFATEEPHTEDGGIIAIRWTYHRINTPVAEINYKPPHLQGYLAEYLFKRALKFSKGIDTFLRLAAELYPQFSSFKFDDNAEPIYRDY